MSAPDKSLNGDDASVEEKAPILHGDEARLKHVLLNLVKNAYKFTTDGVVDVRLSYDVQGGLLHGLVRDTGSGIHKRDIPKLFSRFGKLQRTAEVNHEGIGMGLSVIKLIIE